MAERFFCSEASRRTGETLYGTVALVRSWLLLEYPSVWRRRAVEDSRLISDPVKRRLAAAADRVLLIRQGHRREGELSCFHVNCPDRIEARRISDYEELLGAPADLRPVNGPLYATCTHARHDMCCAKFGLPVACALRDAVGSRAWDCSHVGGDRFAGNVVVFPYGIYYGRVQPADVPDLVRATEAGEIWLPGYRGRSIHPRNVQIADYFARRESGRLSVGEFEVAASSRGDVTFRSTRDGTLHRVRFRSNPEALSERLTCSAEQPSPIAQHELVDYTA